MAWLTRKPRIKSRRRLLSSTAIAALFMTSSRSGCGTWLMEFSLQLECRGLDGGAPQVELVALGARQFDRRAGRRVQSLGQDLLLDVGVSRSCEDLCFEPAHDLGRSARRRIESEVIESLNIEAILPEGRNVRKERGALGTSDRQDDDAAGFVLGQHLAGQSAQDRYAAR